MITAEYCIANKSGLQAIAYNLHLRSGSAQGIGFCVVSLHTDRNNDSISLNENLVTVLVHTHDTALCNLSATQSS